MPRDASRPAPRAGHDARSKRFLTGGDLLLSLPPCGGLFRASQPAPSRAPRAFNASPPRRESPLSRATEASSPSHHRAPAPLKSPRALFPSSRKPVLIGDPDRRPSVLAFRPFGASPVALTGALSISRGLQLLILDIAPDGLYISTIFEILELNPLLEARPLLT